MVFRPFLCALAFALSFASGSPVIAADSSEAHALAKIGRMYAEGRGGVRQSDARAVDKYREAADLGSGDAMMLLRWMHTRGRGVAKNDALAVS